jgi:acyl carrier protein
MSDMATQAEQEAELAGLIVRTLNLDMAASEIDPQAPLFGDGLGLDSIDVLEIALAISQNYGVQLRSDDEQNSAMQNSAIFQSLRSLNQYVQGRRTS